ncbi:mitochondrial substrate carrier family protein [Klebsormidium nitens]|uniref:Mitochondrial substrate carrier family protein n=1 Tax=Klebsormidium nitens TaxID=105231 RepID=A0A1Y1HN02_KLENI|nr:mitochondrial substrate carrier family protein [Klebsormidium nitens]|eukprot:GAQ79393.1 mitochondrial substrate carrier family protein [Klebsormidium nitens]
MQTEHKSCPQHDHVGTRGLLFASISESTSAPRRRKSQSSGEEGTDKKIQLVSSTTVTKKEFTVQDLLIGAVSGGAAGVSVETALYPIDTIKTRLQVLSKGGSLSFKGLYSGLSGNLAGVLPASAIFVAIYEPLKQHLLDRFPEQWSSAAQLLAAGAGATGASIVRVPTEVIKQRMQTGQFTSAAGAVKQILAKEGMKGMYAGYGSFLLRDLPFDAIEFVAYEQIKLAVQRTRKRKELTAVETAFAGALAGAVTGAVTTPLDVIKTRLMVQGTNIKYTGIMDCISKMVAEEGAGSLFKGVGPRVLWIGIGGSIFFGVLEKTKSLLTTELEARKAAKPTTVV